MKRIIAFLVICCYTLSAMGATISFHYCGKQLQSISISGDGSDACCCGAKKKKRKCCHNQLVSVKKLDAKQQLFTKITVPSPKMLGDVALPVYPSYHAGAHYSFAPLSSTQSRPPPLLHTGEPLYILHSVFRV